MYVYQIHPHIDQNMQVNVNKEASFKTTHISQLWIKILKSRYKVDTMDQPVWSDQYLIFSFMIIFIFVFDIQIYIFSSSLYS